MEVQFKITPLCAWSQISKTSSTRSVDAAYIKPESTPKDLAATLTENMH
jgi:hypothetical protein